MINGRKWLAFAVIMIPLVVGILGQPLVEPELNHDAQKSLQAAMQNGNYSLQVSSLETILSFSPWRGDMWQQLGRLYLDTMQSEKAVSAFQAASSLQQLDEQGVIWLADALMKSDHVKESQDLLTDFESDNLFMLNQAAALLCGNQMLDSCEVVLSRALALDPENANLNYQLGVLMMSRQPDKALLYFGAVPPDANEADKAKYLADVIVSYSIDELAGEWGILAGQALSKVGEWRAAVESFRLASEVDSENGVALALLAEAQQQIGEGGFANLQKALALDPQDELVNGLAGLYYRRQGDTEQAMIYFQRAITANPQAAVWHIQVAEALADAGQLEEALVQYRAVVEMDKSDPESWKALAKFSLTRNYQVEETGLAAARQLVLIDPQNPVYLDLLGTAYLALNDLDSAERFFLQALKFDPDEAAILIHLGQTSLYRGDKETAIEYLRRAAANASDERLREMAERLLDEIGAR
jgi:tetratricopeptide (TPR) repeat protein